MTGEHSSTREKVHLYYRAILDREPTDAELRRYADAKPGELRAALLHSDEFVKDYAHKDFRDKWVLTPTRHDHMVWVNLSDTRVSRGCIRGCWEPAETSYVEASLQWGDTFVDLGANVGWFTLIGARLVGPNGSVHAFEPDQTTAQFLSKTLAANGYEESVTLHRVAGGSQNRASLLVRDDERNPGHAWLSSRPLTEGFAAAVEVVRLDDFLKPRLDACHFMKLDVEGAELLVLKGSEQILNEFRPRVMCEVFPEQLQRVSQSSYDDLLEFMFENQYSPTILGRAGMHHKNPEKEPRARYWTTVFEPEPRGP